MDGWKMSFLLGWPIFRCYVNFLESKPQQQKNGNPISNRFPQKAIHLHLSRSWWCRGTFFVCALATTWWPRDIETRFRDCRSGEKRKPGLRATLVKLQQHDTDSWHWNKKKKEKKKKNNNNNNNNRDHFVSAQRQKRNGTNHSDNKQKDVKNVGLPGISKK